LLTDVAAGAGNSIRIRGLRVHREDPVGEEGEPGGEPRTVLLLVGEADSNADIVRFVKALSRSGQLRDVFLVRSQRAEAAEGAQEKQVTFLNFDIEGILETGLGSDPARNAEGAG